MKQTIFLAINRRGTMRLTKNSPGLDRGEIAIRLELNIPDSLFRDYIPTARLTIDPDQVIRAEPTVELLVPEDEGGGYDTEAVWATLTLAMDPVPSGNEIDFWDTDRRREAVEWASAEHLAASDNPVQRKPMPIWLREWADAQ
jgi:hypothetical protein